MEAGEGGVSSMSVTYWGGVYRPALRSAARGGGVGVKFLGMRRHYVSLEWPLTREMQSDNGLKGNALGIYIYIYICI